jgi:hypothetical protein
MITDDEMAEAVVAGLAGPTLYINCHCGRNAYVPDRHIRYQCRCGRQWRAICVGIEMVRRGWYLDELPR